jgi:hypothetical protein
MPRLATILAIILMISGSAVGISTPASDFDAASFESESTAPCGLSADLEPNATQEQCLQETYAPILHFPREEKYRPTSVTEFIQRAEVDEGIEHIKQNASVETLGQRESDSQLVLEDSASYTAYGDNGLPRVVYAQVTEAQFEFSQYIAVTYWMFYFHDPKKAGSKLLWHQ